MLFSSICFLFVLLVFIACFICFCRFALFVYIYFIINNLKTIHYYILMYDYEFPVKYFQIYSELSDKLTNVDNNDESSYDMDDVHSICMEIYQQELVKVCGLLNDDDLNDIGNCLDAVWDQLNINCDGDGDGDGDGNNNRFLQLVSKYQCKHLPGLNANTSSKLYFGMLFDFNLFHITHKCVCELFHRGTISDSVLDELESLIK